MSENNDKSDKPPSSGEAEQVSRRRALKIATATLGGLIGAVLAYPIVRYVLFPVGRKTVSEGSEPIDVLGEGELKAGDAPVKVQLVASGVRNAWSVADDVAVGAAWLRREQGGELKAFSAVCPHLGCAIDYDQSADSFACPCHRSSFALDGEKKSGPSKRGLDPLPVTVEKGRVKLKFKRFKQDIADREEV